MVPADPTSGSTAAGQHSADPDFPATGARYRAFGRGEARGKCALYEAVCERIAGDRSLLALIDRLPPQQRQPNLVLAAARVAGAPTGDAERFVAALRRSWSRVEAVARTRRTQTNEPGRTATLLPVLARLPQPLALIEVGASAGLCLYPDRYSYRYNGRRRLDPADGPSAVHLDCATGGAAPIPRELPTVTHRAGLDLNPIDVTDADDVSWLEALVWPGQQDRLDRLRAAIDIARAAPVAITAGDLADGVDRLVREAADSARTVVVFHSAVLNYVPRQVRTEFVRRVTSLPCRWLANEAPGVLDSSEQRTDGPLRFVLSLDGVPVARTDPHGRRIDWLPTAEVAKMRTGENV